MPEENKVEKKRVWAGFLSIICLPRTTSPNLKWSKIISRKNSI